MIVVDASALVEILIRKPTAKALEVRVLDSGETIHAPHLIDIEIANVLRRLTLARALEAGRARIALDDLAALSLFRYPHRDLLPRVWTLRNNLTAYDAVYVALAEELDASLITRDRRLANAASSIVLTEVF